MFVSVIIPNFNYSIYLRQCIESVIHSYFDTQKMEIIVVDDASTDDSVSLIKEIQEESSANIRIIQNDTNLGLVRSRNRGIVNAKGDLFFFLDADNYIGKECLQIHANILMKHPEYSACFAPIQEFDNETNEHYQLRSNEVFDYKKLLRGPYIDAMAMYRKSDLLKLGMYDVKMPPYGWEDYELWLRMGKKSLKVHFINGKPLSFYRIHKINMSNQISEAAETFIRLYLYKKYKIRLLSGKYSTWLRFIGHGRFFYWISLKKWDESEL